MIKKLKCVIVDDNYSIHKVLRDLSMDSPYVEVIDGFECPKKFLDSVPTLDFEVCLLDIFMPKIDGFTVAKLIKGKSIIFITSDYAEVPYALQLSPVDMVLKPINKERLHLALKKAYYLKLGEKAVGALPEKKKHELFWVAESIAKIKLTLSEIIHVKTDEIDHRNKQILMSDGKEYILMNYSFEDLMDLMPQLIQVNKSELISIDAFLEIKQNVILLKGAKIYQGLPKSVALGRYYRKKFLESIAYA